jgi:processive 1,2-diacylglycerol beta-glucosyltransferase
LGLSADKLTVCINAGWAGGGNLLEVFAELKLVKRAVQVIFLCGHNTELSNRVNEIARQMNFPVVVLPFYEQMADLMTHCDLMVTKAGGLTTFQAVARRLPMALDLITPAMPQESGTDKMLIEQNLAQGIYRPQDIVPIVENLQPAENRLTQSLPYAHSLNRVDAIYDIAHTILAACDPLYDPVSQRQPVETTGELSEESIGALGFEGPLA